MENHDILDENASTGSSVESLSGEAREYLLLAAYWSKFLGIVGYVSTALITLLSIAMLFGLSTALSSAMAASGGGMMAMGSLGVIVGVIYLGVAAFMYFISRSTYNFGTKTKSAFANNSEGELTEAFKNLKSLFRTYGIFMAIVLGFYGVIFGIALIVGLFAMLAR